MLTDFKIVSMVRAGKGISAVVQFYIGDVTTENEFNLQKRAMVPVRRYRRSGVLREQKYTAASEEELMLALKAELANDRLRTPIPEQSLA